MEKDKSKAREDKMEGRIAGRYRSGSLADTKDAESCGTETKMKGKWRKEKGDRKREEKGFGC